jgi:predicted TIM-barrel fold metal-dependent hydrolase
MSQIPTPPLVDTHAHVFTRRLPFIAQSGSEFECDFSIEDYVAELDAAGVKYGVIAAATFLGTYHDYSRAALEQCERLRATVIVDPDISWEQLRALDRAGFVGIRIGTGSMEIAPDLTSAAYRQLFHRVIDLDWHVHVYGRSEHMPFLLSALDQAGVKTVIDHFGARDSQSGETSLSFQALLSAVENGRTWVKLSGPYLSEGLDHRALAVRLLREAGPERLLWGSDWPFVKLKGRYQYRQALEWYAAVMPDTEVRRQIDANALALYRLPRPA